MHERVKFKRLPVILATTWLLLSCSIGFPQDEKRTIDSLQELAELSRAESGQKLPVQLQGTVTFVNWRWNVLFVQNGKHAALAQVAPGSTSPDFAVHPGDVVEITGFTRPGDNQASIGITGVTAVAEGSLPEPLLLDDLRTNTDELTARFVEVSGTIYRVSQGDGFLYLDVATPTGSLLVSCPSEPKWQPVEKLRGCPIKVRGVISLSKVAGKLPRRLSVPPGGLLEIGPVPGDTPHVPVRSISNVLGTKPEADQPLRLVGVVGFAATLGTAQQLQVTDATGTITVTTQRNAGIQAGDVVTLVATRSVDSNSNQSAEVLNNASVHKVGITEVPACERVSAEAASEHISKLIEVIGAVESLSKENDRDLLLMTGSNSIFRVHLATADNRELLTLVRGSRFLIRGLCKAPTEPHLQFEMLADSAVILSRKSVSSPTQESAISTATTAQPDASIADAGKSDDGQFPYILAVPILILLTLVVVLLVAIRAGARRQERLHEALAEQLGELSHVARLNTLSEMVGALAHELNQPITCVMNYTAVVQQLVENDYGAETDARIGDSLSKINSEATRAGEIIRRLRDLIRRRTPGRVPTDLNQVIDETIELFKIQKVTTAGLVTFKAAGGLPIVTIDPIQIQQVILNLLMNAREAAARQPDRRSEITIRTQYDDQSVTVQIDDNGPGISTTDPMAIFEPFFTTREEGTGLGLAISRRIIESHQGFVTAKRLEGGGTRIEFTLPLHHRRSD